MLLDLLNTFWLGEVFQRFLAAPGVTLPCLGVELLVLFRLLKVVWMPFKKADPFHSALEEAEIAPRPPPPLVLGRQTDPTLVQNALDVVDHEAVLLKRHHGLDIRLGRDVGRAVFVSPDPD